MSSTLSVLLRITRFADYIEFYFIAYFLCFWIFPEFILDIDPDAGKALSMHIMVEFVFGHASVALVVAGLPTSKLGKGIGIALLLLFYGGFFAVFAYLGAWIPVLFFLIYIFEKVKRRFSYDGERKKVFIIEISTAFIRMMFFMIAMLPALLLPWPEFGLAGMSLGIEGQGEFIEQPAKMMAWFVIYYSLVAILENKIAPAIRRKVQGNDPSMAKLHMPR